LDQIKWYKLLVDENAIRAISGDSTQSVPRGGIRTLFETKDGLYLSAWTPLSARLRGYIWIPSELPEDKASKDLVLRWSHPSNLNEAAT
jgi:hypothetical protein